MKKNQLLAYILVAALFLVAGSCVCAQAAVKVKSVSLGSKTLSLDPRLGSWQMTATVKPQNAQNTQMLWTSSREDVATVDQTGLLTLKGDGSTIVRVTLKDVGKTASCKVTVKKMPLRSIAISPASVTLYVGDQKKLTTTCKPANTGDDRAVAWDVASGGDVISVDEDGLLHALKAGKAVVRATTSGGITARRNVTVKDVAVKAVALNEQPIIMDKGETAQCTIDITPANAAYRPRTWQSSNTKVATVDETGKVTAVSAGSAVITATCGGKSGTASVLVRGRETVVTISAVGDVILGGDPRPNSKMGKLNSLRKASNNADWTQKDAEGNLLFPYPSYASTSYSSKADFDRLIAENGFDYPFANVARYFQEDDISIVNLEGTFALDTGTRKEKPFRFFGKQEYAGMLSANGIEVASFNNNHTYDYGSTGIAQTYRALRKYGVECARPNNGAVYTVKSEIGNIRIGVCAFTSQTTMHQIRGQIQGMRKKCDILVVNLHWTTTPEWATYSSEEVPLATKSMAHVCIDKGADLVLGHHRHVLSGMEMYRGKLIAYDLSNFIVGIKHKNQFKDGTTETDYGLHATDTGILRVQMSFNEAGFVETKSVGFVPCTVSDCEDLYPADNAMGNRGAPISRWQPAVLEGSEAKRLMKAMRKMSPGVEIEQVG